MSNNIQVYADKATNLIATEIQRGACFVDVRSHTHQEEAKLSEEHPEYADVWRSIRGQLSRLQSECKSIDGIVSVAAKEAQAVGQAEPYAKLSRAKMEMQYVSVKSLHPAFQALLLVYKQRTAGRISEFAMKFFWKKTSFPEKVDKDWFADRDRDICSILDLSDKRTANEEWFGQFLVHLRGINSASSRWEVKEIPLDPHMKLFYQWRSAGQNAKKMAGGRSGGCSEVLFKKLGPLHLVHKFITDPDITPAKLKASDALVKSLVDIEQVVQPLFVNIRAREAYLLRADSDLFGYVYASEGEAIRDFLYVAKGLKAMHERKIVHCDVKPDNMLKFKDRVKLIDFDFATDLSTQKLKLRGTPIYISPELWRSPSEADQSVDAFALGISFYELLGNWSPKFRLRNRDEIYRDYAAIPRRNESMMVLEVDIKIANNPKSKMLPIIRGLLMPNPNERLTLETAIKTLDPSYERVTPDSVTVAIDPPAGGAGGPSV